MYQLDEIWEAELDFWTMFTSEKTSTEKNEKK